MQLYPNVPIKVSFLQHRKHRYLLYPHTFAILKKKKKRFSNKMTCVTSLTSDRLSTGSVSPTLAYRVTQRQSSMLIFYLNLKEPDTCNLFCLIKISNLVMVKCYFYKLSFQRAFMSEKIYTDRD